MKNKKAKESAEKQPEKVTFVETPYDAQLKVALTSGEIMAEAEKMARLQQDIAAKEDEAASVNKRYKSEVEGLICSQDICAGLIRDKFRFQTVRCMRRMDWETGMVTETRTDTAELLNNRTMTVAETQMQLTLNEEKKAKEPVEQVNGETPVTQPTPSLEPITEEEINTAVEIIKAIGRANSATLMRKMKINAARASSLLDVLEHRGIVGAPKDDGEPREILIDLSKKK